MTDHQKDYWQRTLAGLEPLQLPTDRRRSAMTAEPARASLDFELPGPVAPATLLAVFQLLLAKYSGQQDLAVRVPAGRDGGSVLVRTDLSGDPGFDELLDRVAAAADAAARHPELPAALRDDADLLRLPALGLPGAGDLGLGATGSRATVEYRTDLFEPATIARLAGHYRTLLAAATASPSARLSELELLTDAERRQLLTDWNGPTVDFPAHLTVHQLVEQQAAQNPELTAVGDLTYRELNERANQLAHHLRAQGITPGTLIAVCLERGPELVTTLLGILKSGAAYIPMDPEYPTDRLTYLITDSATPLVITNTTHTHQLPTNTPLLLTDRNWPTGPTNNPDPLATPDDLAYTIYTSGSTGHPKGVQVEHRSLVNLIHWHNTTFNTQPGNRVALLAGVAFDAAAWELWPALAAGANCRTTNETTRLTPTLLQQWLTDQHIRGTFLSTPMLEALATLPWNPHTTTLEHVLTGGDQLHLPTDQHLPFRIINNYGPTEATVLVTSTHITPGDPIPPIGRPINNSSLHVVDPHGHLVPIGIPGELLISGTPLARGYLNQPTLTAEKFTHTPYGRAYHTGDLVKWRTDGQLEFLGRIDNQVKIRGHRIELGEIEATLLTHPAVTTATVIVREDTPGHKQLTAYLTPTNTPHHDLRTHLTRTLPDYMIPTTYITLDHLPLTPNGKIDRKALPAPELTTTAYVAPQTPVEQAITAVWAEVLGVERVGRDDDFFQLGGHSLLATRVTSRLHTALGVDIPFRTLFAAPTPARLAAAIAALDTSEASRPVPVPRDGAPLPLSFAQQRLWFLDQLEPGSSDYLIPFALRVNGPLDLTALESALSGIVARHEVLRTRFVADADGQPAQHLDPPAPLTVAVHDLRDLRDRRDLRDLRELPDAEAREAAARELLRTESRRPIDLATGPLLRATLLRLADAESVLALTVHHIAFDGWSVALLARELTDRYAAAVDPAPGSGTQEPAELPLQYADFALWQRQWLSEERIAGQLDYWRGQLAAIEPLELPTDHRRPARRGAAGAATAFTIPAELAARLRATATESGASLFMVLLATFQLLLAKYSRQHDITVGTPIAGRNRAEIEDMIGFFVNTLVIRTDLSGDPTFTELLDRVKETALGAYDHQDLPFERLVEELAPDRDPARNPLFQTAFALQNVPDLDSWQLAGAAVEVLTPDVQDAKFDLTLTVVEGAGEELRATVEYRTDLFEPATIARLAGHYRTLLAAATASPSARLSELELLTDAERRQLLTDWNGPTVDFPAHLTVHQLVEQQAAQNPELTAVGDLTYRELNERANQLAHHLRAQGITPGTLIAVCLERGPELVTTLLGILKSGAAYIPMDPEYPTDRLTYLITDSATPLVITNTTHTHQLPTNTPLLLTDRNWPTGPTNNPDPLATPDDLAYTIYTSGSTGHPKGVQVEHRSLVNLIHWHNTTFNTQPGNRVALLAGVAFDAAAWELWPALAAGANCRTTNETTRLTPTLLQQWLTDQHIRGTFLSTPMLEALATLPWNPHTTTLEHVLTGGDQLHLPTDQHLPFRIINNYGPTEATVLVTSTHITPGDPIPPIGRPINNSSLHVVDPHGHLVPIGIPGELLISGTPLARGYLNQPTLTAEKFTHTPYGRAYHTGDLVKWRTDGQLEFLGRIDNQVKIRGHRIELGEIEATLLTHPAVTTATVIVREDTPGHKQLTAYLTPTNTPHHDLRTHLTRTLPDYMIPTTYITLDHLPLTPNGKIDRKALPAPAAQPEASAQVAPRTPTEEAVTAIWREILGVESIGVHDNFFQLGGHSLLATRVTSRIRAALGVDLPVRTLFTAPTPAELATEIAESATAQPDATGPAAHSLALVPRDGTPLPLSFAQQRLWFLDQLEPGSSDYLIPFALRVNGPLDLTALRTALAGLLARHEILRTRFVADAAGEPAQHIDPPTSPTVTVHDLREHPAAGASEAAAREAAARQLLLDAGRRPFDLAAGPLLRVDLVRLADQEQLVQLTVHHIVADGWSEAVLAGELRELYGAALRGSTPALPEPGAQYADFASWQRGWLTGEVLDRQLDYWRAQLSAIEPLELPTDHRRPTQRDGGDDDTVLFTVPAELAERVRAIATESGVSLFMVLLATFQLLLAKYSRQQDITVGTPIAGRNRAEIEDMIGFFVNTLVIRTDLSGDPTFTELLDRVKETALGAYDHQDLPFERLVEELAPDRDPARNPLFQTMFVLQNATEAGHWQLPGTTVTPLPVTGRQAKFDLTLSLSEAADGAPHDTRLDTQHDTQHGSLIGSLEYRADLFERATIERLIGHFQTLLAAATATPGARLSELELLAGAERRQVLVEWNDTTTDHPDAATIHSFFEEWAERTPDALATRGEQGELTYRQVNERANRLAHHLRGLGVRPDSLVAVCLQRGADLICAVLGVLKSGAGYLPLDPDYPADRLAFMVEDSGTPLVITDTGHAPLFPAGVPAFLTDHDWTGLAAQPVENPPAVSGPENLAYTIYTSGSTGKPKGVQVQHRSIVNLINWTTRNYRTGPGDRVALLAGVAFDAGAWELWLALTSGATCCTTSETVRLTPALLQQWLNEQEIRGTFLSTPMLESLAALSWDSVATSLDYILTGGDLLRLPAGKHLPFRVVNGYGPTETTVIVTSAEVTPGDPVPPIGRPIANTQVYVVDPQHRPQPTGVPGELLIGGVGVARGYLGRPDLTAEKFVDLTLDGTTRRVYRSGDLVKWRSDGQLEFLGRIDNQVKLRGFRIELGEIEATLLTHPAVTAATVTVREDTPGEKRLVGYLVAEPAPTAAELHAHLAPHLPGYMIPAAFVVLERLPLTPNGKTDRRALPAPDNHRPEVASYAAPRNPVEKAITALWSDILGIDTVGIHDDFFHLGGHSLLATQVTSRIRTTLGVDLPVRTLFTAPTPARLATAIRELMLAGIADRFGRAR
ncbi:amino acid adenylation domain-containing protein [Kitasatospora sp. NBC_01287]|uniref:non-ribosomal peptide synthetase n=1 Tax=Kitasatospora sp. NBC_01287 TaxID=2903573 RepID=UPI0022507B22|nr:non-ribosomal peptide synthetase [Kitasatospora sp. NBC_01287]MCX4744348.1 amino acid adenylation domain-containing protein [Kitasatospora sp. NBC_01287]